VTAGTEATVSAAIVPHASDTTWRPTPYVATTSPAKKNGKTSELPKIPRPTSGYARAVTAGVSGPYVPRPPIVFMKVTIP